MSYFQQVARKTFKLVQRNTGNHIGSTDTPPHTHPQTITHSYTNIHIFFGLKIHVSWRYYNLLSTHQKHPIFATSIIEVSDTRATQPTSAPAMKGECVNVCTYILTHVPVYLSSHKSTHTHTLAHVRAHAHIHNDLD